MTTPTSTASPRRSSTATSRRRASGTATTTDSTRARGTDEAGDRGSQGQGDRRVQRHQRAGLHPRDSRGLRQLGGVGKRRVELPEAGALLQYGGDGHHLPGRSRRLPRRRRAHYLPPVPTGGVASGEQGLVRGLARQRAAVLRRPQRPGHHRSGAHTRKQSQRHPLVHGHRVPGPLAPPAQPDNQGQRDGQENTLRHHRGTPAGRQASRRSPTKRPSSSRPKRSSSARAPSGRPRY